MSRLLPRADKYATAMSQLKTRPEFAKQRIDMGGGNRAVVTPEFQPKVVVLTGMNRSGSASFQSWIFVS